MSTGFVRFVYWRRARAAGQLMGARIAELRASIWGVLVRGKVPHPILPSAAVRRRGRVGARPFLASVRSRVLSHCPPPPRCGAPIAPSFHTAASRGPCNGRGNAKGMATPWRARSALDRRGGRDTRSSGYVRLEVQRKRKPRQSRLLTGGALSLREASAY